MRKDSKKTVQNKESEVKTLFERIDREFFMLYCDENKVLEGCVINLVEMANDDSDKGIKAKVNMFLVEQLIGKPKQGVDLGLEQGIEIKITRRGLDEGDQP